LNTFFFRNY